MINKRNKAKKKKSSRTWEGEYFSQVRFPGSYKKSKANKGREFQVDWDDELPY